MKPGVQRILIALILLAISLWTTWPLLNHCGSVLPTVSEYSTHLNNNDPAMFVWNLWWTTGWLNGEHPLLHCNMLHYPYGISLARHTLSIGNGIPAALMAGWINSIACLNLLLIFHALLTAFATWLLARELAVDPWSALLSALIFTWWPVRLIHATFHLNLASTGWMVLTLFFSIRGIRRRNWLYAIPACITCILTGACSWHLFSGLLIILAAITLMPTEKKTSTSPAPWPWHIRSIFLAAIVLIALLVLSPLIVPLTTPDPDAPVRPISEKEKYSIHPVYHIIPSATSMIWGDSVRKHYADLPGNIIENTGFLGLCVIVIAALGFRSKNRSIRYLLLVSLGFIVLSWGPSFHVRSLTVPLPGRCLELVPGLAESRTPGRYLIHAGLLISLVCGYQFQQIARQNTKLRVLIPLCIFLEILPRPIATIQIPDTILQQNATTFTGPILDVPNDWTDRSLLLSQVFHQQPVTTGFCSRMPRTVFQRIQETPLLADLSVRPPQLSFQALSLTENQLKLAQLKEILGVKIIRYPSGKYLDLSDIKPSESPEAFLLDRWSGPDNWGPDLDTVYWGVWPRARIRLTGVTHDRITFSCQILSAEHPDNQPVSVTVTYRDSVVHNAIVSRNWTKMAFDIPVDTTCGSDQDLWFHFDPGTAPATLHPDTTHDIRLLAAAISNPRICAKTP